MERLQNMGMGKQKPTKCDVCYNFAAFAVGIHSLAHFDCPLFALLPPTKNEEKCIQKTKRARW